MVKGRQGEGVIRALVVWFVQKSVTLSPRHPVTLSACQRTDYTGRTMRTRTKHPLPAVKTNDTTPIPNTTMQRLVDLREILRYVPQYRDKVFVIAFDGAIVESDNFRNLLLDLALL